MFVYFVMLVLNCYDCVLIIGGGDGLVFCDVLKWFVKYVILVDLDG